MKHWILKSSFLALLSVVYLHDTAFCQFKATANNAFVFASVDFPKTSNARFGDPVGDFNNARLPETELNDEATETDETSVSPESETPTDADTEPKGSTGNSRTGDGAGFRGGNNSHLLLEDESQIYPNPTHGKVNVDVGGDSERGATITVFNTLGQQVPVPVRRSGKLYEFDLTGFPSGIYFVRIENNGRTNIHRVNLK